MLGGRQGGWEGGGERGGLRGSRGGEGGRGKKARTWQVIALSSGKIGSMYTGRPGGARIRTSPGVFRSRTGASGVLCGEADGKRPRCRQAESEPASGRYETALHRKSREGLGPRSVGQPVAQGTCMSPWPQPRQRECNTRGKAWELRMLQKAHRALHCSGICATGHR